MVELPGHVERELVFQHAVEGLFHVGLRGMMTPTLQSRLKEAGLDLSRPLDPAYPRAAWTRFLNVAVQTLWPHEPPERGYHLLGRRLILGYSETFIGKALLPALRLFGPKRTLERMTRNFRSGANFNQTRVTFQYSNQALYWMNEAELHPSYVAGILDAALEFAGARNVDIQVHSRDAEGCTYCISWSS